jgi:hypothetical protein
VHRSRLSGVYFDESSHSAGIHSTASFASLRFANPCCSYHCSVTIGSVCDTPAVLSFRSLFASGSYSADLGSSSRASCLAVQLGATFSALVLGVLTDKRISLEVLSKKLSYC